MSKQYWSPRQKQSFWIIVVCLLLMGGLAYMLFHEIKQGRDGRRYAAVSVIFLGIAYWKLMDFDPELKNGLNKL